jgi:hypothetical protein
VAGAPGGEAGGDLLRSLEDSERDGDIPYVCDELPRAIERTLDGIALAGTANDPPNAWE